jgi:hypothetical protein
MKCHYGCGKEATHQFENGKWCCSKSKNSCISIKKKRKLLLVKIEPSYMFCSYGCGNFARFYFKKVNKWCCSSHYQSCLTIHNKSMVNQLYIEFDNVESILCDYGCGKIAKFTNLRKDKFCCSKNWSQCKEVKRKNSLTNSIKQKGENNARFGVIVTDEVKRKIRLGNIKDLENKHGQIFPNYNKNACKLIDEYGKQNGYKFKHAENGGEYYIKELGYWVDGYDIQNNIVIEIDEISHFDSNGNLKNKDITRQKEIENFLCCKFIRIKNFEG